MASSSAACRRPDPARSSRPHHWRQRPDPATLAPALLRRRHRRPRPAGAGGRWTAADRAGDGCVRRAPGADQAPAEHRDPAPARRRGRGTPGRSSPELHHGAGDRSGARPRAGDAGSGGAGVVSGSARARVPAPGGAPEPDVAGRPHRARPPHRRRRREARPPLADRDHGRLLPRDLRVHRLHRRPVGDEHRTGAPASDLEEARSRLGDVRDPRHPPRRPRHRLHQPPPRAHRRGAADPDHSLRCRPSPGPREDRAVLRHHHHRAAPAPPRSPGRRQPASRSRARPGRPRLGHRVVHHHLQRAPAQGARCHSADSVGR